MFRSDPLCTHLQFRSQRSHSYPSWIEQLDAQCTLLLALWFFTSTKTKKEDFSIHVLLALKGQISLLCDKILSVKDRFINCKKNWQCFCYLFFLISHHVEKDCLKQETQTLKPDKNDFGWFLKLLNTYNDLILQVLCCLFSVYHSGGLLPKFLLYNKILVRI